MITAAPPPPFEKRAIVLSVAVHCCALAFVLALIPANQAIVGGHGTFDRAASCELPCAQVFALRIEHRARPAVLSDFAAGTRRIPAAPVRPPHQQAHRAVAYAALVHRAHFTRTVNGATTTHSKTAAAPPATRAAEAAAATDPGTPATSVAGEDGAGTNLSLATPTTEEPVASRVQPNANAANPSTGVETASDAQARRASLGPANWGSRIPTPILRDRALLEEVLARIGSRGLVTIAVDDEGRATDVKIKAPGLDAAVAEDLRKRLLAARYIPLERDGVAFEGTLQLKADATR